MWQSATILPSSTQKPRCSKPSCALLSEWQEDFRLLKEQIPAEISGFCAGAKHPGDGTPGHTKHHLFPSEAWG